jgi:hypothetical protein
VLAALRLLIEKYSGAENTQTEARVVILNALYRDAIVQFVECFRKGPFNLNFDEVYKGIENAAVYYKSLQDERDAYAAHRFGAYRQCVTGIIVDPNFNVLGVGQIQGIYSAPNADGLRQLGAFVNIASQFAEAKMERLRLKLTDETKDLRPEQVRALKPARIVAISSDQIMMTRKQVLQRGDELWPMKKTASPPKPSPADQTQSGDPPNPTLSDSTSQSEPTAG